MFKKFIFILLGSLLINGNISARQCNLPQKWQKLCGVLQGRVLQNTSKMKLQESDAKVLEQFLHTTTQAYDSLVNLQYSLPKTTTELLFSICKRGITNTEAESMASYLQEVVDTYQFQNVKAFDNNTSHIIGREWHEIDYAGEKLTWQNQKKFYAPYGIENFKSLNCLRKFFSIEAHLSYFNKIYKPKKIIDKNS